MFDLESTIERMIEERELVTVLNSDQIDDEPLVFDDGSLLDD